MPTLESGFSQSARPFRARAKITFTTLLCALVIGCTGDLTEDQYLQRAQESWANGDATSSAVDLKSALNLNPDNMEARLFLGEIYLEIEDGASALKELRLAELGGAPASSTTVPMAHALYLTGEYQSLIDDYPIPDTATSDQKAMLLAFKARSHIKKEEIEEAKALLREALTLNAKLDLALLGSAEIAFSEQDNATARKIIATVLQGEPNNSEAWHLLGEIALADGDPEKALEAYTTAMNHAYVKTTHQYQRALVLLKLNKFDAAAAEARALPNTFYGRFYLLGLTSMDKEDYDSAASNLEKARNLNPEFSPTLLALGTAHVHLGNSEQAYQYLTSYLAQEPGSVKTHLLLANTELSRGDNDSARNRLQRILEQYPENKEALALMSSIEFGRGEYEDALSYQEQAMSGTPDSDYALTNLALYHFYNGDTEKAVELLSKASEMTEAPNKADLLLVYVQLEEGNFKEAMATSERIREKDPSDPQANNMIALVYIAEGKFDEARGQLNGILKEHPQNNMAINSLARLEMLEGNYDIAAGLYQRQLKNYPNDIAGAIQLANLQARQGDIDAFKQTLRTSIENNPRAAEPRVVLARFYTITKQPKLVLELLKPILDFHPDNVQVLSLVGEAQLNTQLFGQAGSTYRHLTTLRPTSVGARIGLAVAYQGQGDRRQEREQLLAAIALDDSSLSANVGLAKLYLAEKNIPEAKAIIEKLNGGNAKSPHVLELNGDLATLQGNTESALSYYGKAAAQSDSSPLMVKISDTKMVAGDFQGAVEALLSAVERDPNNTVALARLTNLYLINGNDTDAAKVLERLNRLQPDNPTTLNNLAWILRESNPVRALGYAEKANQIAPGQPGILDTLAMLQLQKGNMFKAAEYIQEAARGAPDNNTITYHRALITSEVGNTKRAVSILEKLLESDGLSENIQKEAGALLAKLTQ